MDYREIIPLKQSLNLTLALPGSKSITNRAFLCAALAKGKTKIYGALESDDTAVMLDALRKLGVRSSKFEGGIVIEGVGGRFKKGKVTLDLHNAGTAVRFLTAVMCMRDGETVITGDQRMQERPIRDLVNGLRQLGFDITYQKKSGYPPLQVLSLKSQVSSQNNVVKMKGNKSSQYFSALLMLAPLLDKPVTIEVVGELVSKPYIDTTIAVLTSFGIKVKNNNYQSFEVKPQAYKATSYHVEGDATAASYWSSLNFLHGGYLKFENLDTKKSIQGDSRFDKILNKFRSQISDFKSEMTVDMNEMPDAAMTLAVTAPFVNGSTKITGLSTLRFKETDRLKALKRELKKVGADVSTSKDSITVRNSKLETRNSKLIQTYNDHRMAMCFAVLGTKIPGVVIENPNCVDKTYPTFWKDLEKAYLAPLELGDKHLVLTGMRGAGKTYLGERIADYLKRPFIDIDQEIEKEQGRAIREMVRDRGWGYFRAVEQNFCSRVAIEEHFAKEPLVISTGGGCVLNPDNMRHLKENAVTVFLYADPHVLTERVMSQKSRPPLKKGQDPEKEIEFLWQTRRDTYLKYADVVWDNTSGEVINDSFKDIFDKNI